MDRGAFAGFEALGAPIAATSSEVAAAVPLFAASVDCALDCGCALTRRFVDALPPALRSERLVIDSTLVWLRPGLFPGEPLWHREAFPRQARGWYGRANGEHEAVHVAWVAGGLAPPAFVVGDDDGAALPDPGAGGRWDESAHRARHAQVAARVDAGALVVTPTPPGVLHRYRGGAMRRETTAEGSGFRFWIRATAGSGRPFVNGRCNITNLSP